MFFVKRGRTKHGDRSEPASFATVFGIYVNADCGQPLFSECQFHKTFLGSLGYEFRLLSVERLSFPIRVEVKHHQTWLTKLLSDFDENSDSASGRARIVHLGAVFF